jgi:hypothetical protein
VYPDWGWGTDDSEQALSLLKRFGSVTVLNGHIHQIMQKVEGNMSFHTAMSTAFPQPTPGTAPAPGPMKVDPEKLKSVLGIANVTFIPAGASRWLTPPCRASAGVRGRVTRGNDETQNSARVRTARPERDRHRQLQLHAADADRESRHHRLLDQHR